MLSYTRIRIWVVLVLPPPGNVPKFMPEEDIPFRDGEDEFYLVGEPGGQTRMMLA